MLRANNFALQNVGCSKIHAIIGSRLSWPRTLQHVARSAGYPQGGYPQGGYQQGGYPQGGYPQDQGGYYPPIPPYVPSEPSAPPMPSDQYSQASASDYGSSGYAPSAVLSEAEQLAAEDLELLRSSAGQTRNLSTIGFWLQFALSVVSAVVLLFSTAFVPKVTGGFSVVDISKYLTLVGVVAAFISSLFAHGFLTLSKKLQDGGNVARSYMVGTLLTNNAICLGGIAITVIGLQASVGTLVAKSLMTAMAGPYQYSASGSGLVSLDVFALQASTNTLLCHVIGLLFTNLMLRFVNRR